MKKQILFLSLFILVVSSFSNYLRADDRPNNQEIQLKKEHIGGPYRTPALYPVGFSAMIFLDEFILSCQNYSDDITVQIIGIAENLVLIQQISDSTPVSIDISSLPEGTYTIEIITNGKGIFTGDFEI